MDFKKYAVDELKLYGEWLKTIDDLREEINRLNSIDIKSIPMNPDPIIGGSSKYEDFMLSTMIEREQKKESLEFMEWKMHFIKKALGKLGENERKILIGMYVEDKPVSVDKLSMELNFAVSTIWKIRNIAIQKYTRYRLGIVNI